MFLVPLVSKKLLKIILITINNAKYLGVYMKLNMLSYNFLIELTN